MQAEGLLCSACIDRGLKAAWKDRLCLECFCPKQPPSNTQNEGRNKKWNMNLWHQTRRYRPVCHSQKHWHKSAECSFPDLSYVYRKRGRRTALPDWKSSYRNQLYYRLAGSIYQKGTPQKLTAAMANRHMRRSACWKAGETEIICWHGGLGLCCLAGNNKGSLDQNLRFT